MSDYGNSLVKRIFQSPPPGTTRTAADGPCAPTPLLRPRPPAADIPRDCLGPFAPAVAAIGETTAAPLAIAAQSVLGAAALAVQGHADVDTLGGRRPTSLFLLTVAESGERKSACDALATNAIREIERARSRDWPAERERHRAAAAIHEAEIARLAKTTDVIERDADMAAVGPPPGHPLAPQILLPDPTIEGLCRFFEEGRPSVGVFSDEGGQLLGGHGMSAENRLKSGAGFSKLWDGGPLNRTRASGPSVTYHGRRVALHLMIQPGAAEALLGNAVLRDQGFLNRMLIAWPESRIGTRFLPEGADPSQKSHASRQEAADLAAFDARITALLEMAPPTAEGDQRELQPRLLRLTTEARDILIGFFNACEHEMRDGGALAAIRGFAAKAPEQAARIAGVMAVFGDPDAPAISGRTMAASTRLMSWYIGEAQRVLDAGEIAPAMQQAEALRQWIVERSGREAIAVRTVTRYGPNAIRDSQLARRLIKILEEHGWLIPIDGGAVIDGAKSKAAWRMVNQ